MFVGGEETTDVRILLSTPPYYSQVRFLAIIFNSVIQHLDHRIMDIEIKYIIIKIITLLILLEWN